MAAFRYGRGGEEGLPIEIGGSSAAPVADLGDDLGAVLVHRLRRFLEVGDDTVIVDLHPSPVLARGAGMYTGGAVADDQATAPLGLLSLIGIEHRPRLAILGENSGVSSAHYPISNGHVPYRYRAEKVGIPLTIQGSPPMS